MDKIGIVSLGCAKNQVDLEEILAYLRRNGFVTVSDPRTADIIIINTCGFIDAAKKESIDAILDMIRYDKPVVVTGCLTTRYLEELKKEIPEVALWVPLSEYKNFGKLFQTIIKDRKISDEGVDPTQRVLISPEREAYLRISDGCDNFCNFCAIPHIRGRFQSVPFDTLKKELDIMDSQGIRSVTVISQDTSMYGRDLGNVDLVDLTKEIVSHKNFDFIKLMYLYPDEVKEELIDLFAANSNLTPYFDLPVQHFSNAVLKHMGRRGSEQDILSLLEHFRKKVPDAVLRTTVMVGFPGETEEDFQECLDQIKKVKFDHLGCFMFCPEEGTPAYKFKDQVPEEVKLQRYNTLMKEQKKISYQLNKERVGKTYKALITKYNPDDYSYDCITNLYAPDDIDGKMRIFSKVELHPGDLVMAKVVNALVYDLDAEMTEILRKA